MRPTLDMNVLQNSTLGPQIYQLLPFIARDLVVDMVIHKFWLLFPALPPIYYCFVGIFLILLNN